LADLLQVASLSTIVAPKNKVALMLDFRINPDCAPFLVSSTRSLVWVSKFRNDIVRAAIRRGVPSIGHYFMEVVLSVEKMGGETEWGNVHSLTRKGIQAALDHLKFYEIEDVILLVSTEGFDKDIAKAWRKTGTGDEEPTILGCPYALCDWLHPGYVVAIPRNREFIGFLGWGNGNMVSVVHNASRGIALARRPGKVIPLGDHQ